MASIWLKEAPETAPEGFRGAVGGPEETRTNGFAEVAHCVLDSHASGLPSAQDGPGGLPDRPKRASDDSMTAENGLKRAQRGSLNGTRELQEEAQEGP